MYVCVCMCACACVRARQCGVGGRAVRETQKQTGRDRQTETDTESERDREIGVKTRTRDEDDNNYHQQTSDQCPVSSVPVWRRPVLAAGRRRDVAESLSGDRRQQHRGTLRLSQLLSDDTRELTDSLGHFTGVAVYVIGCTTGVAVYGIAEYDSSCVRE